MALTVETEANKLAANTRLGRNFAGIHYRSDGVAGTGAGERVAVSYLTDLLATKSVDAYDECASFTFTTFDDTEVEVTATDVRPTGSGETQAFDLLLYI